MVSCDVDRFKQTTSDMTQATVGQFIAKNIATDLTGDLTHVEFMGYNPPSFGGTIDTKGFLEWFEEIEAIFLCGDCREEDKVKFATCTFRDLAQEWWNQNVRIVGVDAAYSRSWEKLKRMMSLRFCVKSELREMEQEALNLTMVGDDVDKYTTRFYELVRLGPAMDEPEGKRIERYIGGLSPEIRKLVISSKPDTMIKAVNRANEAKEYIAHTKTLRNNSDNKRKWGNDRGDNATQQSSKRQEIVKAYAVGRNEKKGYNGILPECNKCQTHHNPGNCPRPCDNCGRIGHPTRKCKAPRVTDNQNPPASCFGCGEVGHFKNNCPKGRNQG
jgi:hypothetical protein